MKKLTCTLLMAMFTTTSMLFAQISSSGPVIVVSDYFTITNKNTKESKKVEFSKFTSEGNNSLTYDVDFCLGVYNGDEIEITYKPEIALNPQTAWSYSWNGGSSYNLGTAFTAKLSTSSVPYNGSTLTFTCNHTSGNGISGLKSYNIHFKNVHNEKRIYVSYNNVSREVLLFYENCEKEVVSCANQVATAELYNLSNKKISSGSFTPIGLSTLATKGNTGTLVVKVLVNDVYIFTEKISAQ